jgi:hypothetical protein
MKYLALFVALLPSCTNFELVDRLRLDMSEPEIVEMLGEPLRRHAFDADRAVWDYTFVASNVIIWPLTYPERIRLGIEERRLVVWGSEEEMLSYMKNNRWNWPKLEADDRARKIAATKR